MNIEFKLIDHGSTDWKRAVDLREKILRLPLGDKFTAAELDEEKNHIQVIGLLENELIATAVLVPENDSLKMQRVVVSDEYRNLNIGSKMMVFCEKYGRDNSYVKMYCHARDSAVNFYLKNSYVPEGDYFNEDGIPHLKMIKFLKLKQ